MKKKIILTSVLAISIAFIVATFLHHSPNFAYPDEYVMNIRHVSDQSETAKYGKQVGGNCYLASTAMMLKSFDPEIDFWEVFVYQGNAVSFSYYFPGGPDGCTAADLMDGSTEILLTAASNIGFTPHVRMPAYVYEMKSWKERMDEIGGDFHSYIVDPPMDEYKHVISTDIPIGTSGSPCHNDYNVIEGYSEKELFAVIPNPQDVGRTDPKICCSIGPGLTNTVFWFTPDGEKISVRELMLEMKAMLNESFENMERYISNLEEGACISEFSQNVYLGRKFASMYFDEQGYHELADGYNKSSEALLTVASIYPPDIGDHKDEVIVQMQKVIEIEKGLSVYWNEIK